CGIALIHPDQYFVFDMFEFIDHLYFYPFEGCKVTLDRPSLIYGKEVEVFITSEIAGINNTVVILPPVGADVARRFRANADGLALTERFAWLDKDIHPVLVRLGMGDVCAVRRNAVCGLIGIAEKIAQRNATWKS